MARDATKEVTTTSQSGNLPAGFDLSAEMDGVTDLGFSDKADDSLVPILAVLQDNSGEVKKGHAKKIDGAGAGNGILRSLKIVLPLDTEPLTVIPFGFTHRWVQWRGEPGEGKIITDYDFEDRPGEAVEVQDPQNEDRTFWQMPNRDRLVDTRYHYVLANIQDRWMPITIPMAGTNHTASRSWTALAGNMRLPGGGKMPGWFRKWLIKTKFNQRGQQSWYNYDITDGGWVEERELRDLGKSLNANMSILRPDTASENQGDDGHEDEDTPV
jgi:hypothetical protein